jgi:ABC-type nitrate/sulfonate/bicarbonate transport system permease component
VIALAASFPVILNTFAGARSIDANLIRASRSLGATEFEIFKGIVLPASQPSRIRYLASLRLIGPLTVLLTWELAARFGLVNTLLFPPPSKAFADLEVLVASGYLWKALLCEPLPRRLWLRSRSHGRGFAWCRDGAHPAGQ